MGFCTSQVCKSCLCIVKAWKGRNWHKSPNLSFSRLFMLQLPQAVVLHNRRCSKWGFELMIFHRGRREGKMMEEYRSVETPVCDGNSIRVAEPGKGVEMSSQDLMNNSSFTLQNPVKKIITDNISKVSATNCMHAEFLGSTS